MYFSSRINRINRKGSPVSAVCWKLVICINFLTIGVSAQNKAIHGVVVSDQSGEKIAFASITWKKSGTGSLCDSTGEFTIFLRKGHDTLIISHVGYDALYIPMFPVRDTTLLIFRLTEKKSNEVLVNKKYNRGLLWWKKVVQYKTHNDPFQFRDFSCDLYKKMEMDLTNITKEGFEKIKLLKPFRFLLENMDSVSETKEFLPVFMMEKISRFWLRNNPQEKSEQVEAYRTSGINNEVVLHFLEGLISAYLANRRRHGGASEREIQGKGRQGESCPTWGEYEECIAYGRGTG
jgi:hypothetical protein